MTRVWGRLTLAVIAIWAALALPASAHPHIWVDTYAKVVFNDQGELVRIDQDWVFDKAFSAWAIQGLDSNHDGKIESSEMQELADDYIDGLSHYEFYTFAGEGTGKLVFHAGPKPHMSYDGERVHLFFSVVPKTPARVDQDFQIEVVDPEYYVDFTFPSAKATVLENAPKGCTVVSHQPKELPPDIAKRLSQVGVDVHILPPDLKKAVEQISNMAVINCPVVAGERPAAPEAKTALDAVTQVAGTKPAPFEAPPPEVSMPMPTTGFLGWVNRQQKAFYHAMTNALSELKTDNRGFLILGLLSFLYGVFHAAGPGHGKVVISSYVMAGERELRRGIALSFAAALLQSVVAISFVMIVAAALDMTSTAMSGATSSIERVSYAMVVLLGLYLIARKVFGFGHRHDHHGHDHAHDHGHGHGHGHGHDHGHHHHHDHGADVCSTPHSVSARDAARGWREALAIVVAVGLRPCSGALIVMVFALSQGLMLAGMAAVLMMGVGTAITVATLASLAVFAKSTALALGKRTGGRGAARFVSALELLGAFAVLALGIIMLWASFV